MTFGLNLRGGFGSVDKIIALCVLGISAFGLATLFPIGVSNFFNDGFFVKQAVYVLIGFALMFGMSHMNLSYFLKESNNVLFMYLLVMALLVGVLIFGSEVNGAKSWFDFGFLSFQPADFAKLALIIILAKYFWIRHIEVNHFKHIIISLIYATVPFLLILVQPDFGSAFVILSIWFGMILSAGISYRHVAVFVLAFAVLFGGMWAFVFKDYQKDRILNFLNPGSDIQNTGYNSYQSLITVGSGKLLGKGVGYGTQSRFGYLPESETDFIFASFAEEWGFVGSFLLLLLYGVLIWRMMMIAGAGVSNFELLFITGFTIMIAVQTIINVGMNLGLLPVSGLTLPFMSYGGSHMLVEFAGLGMVMSMARYNTRRGPKDEILSEADMT